LLGLATPAKQLTTNDGQRTFLAAPRQVP
jgi:hypothetical protein